MESLGKLNRHNVLAHSYIIYFVLLLIAVYLDSIYDLKIMDDTVMLPIGVVFLIVAPILIIWAQKSGRDLRRAKEVTIHHFCVGPYCYTRVPTQWGLFLLVLGFGFVTNSFFVITFTAFAFLISKFLFMHKQEKVLEQKYGATYLEYKKKVKF
ncbi:MAG: hypothetical protein WCI76_03025 [bacterium]